MKLIKLILAALLVTAGTAHAQTWFTVANEGDTVVFNVSPVTVQFGVPAGTPVTVGSVSCVTVGGCWEKPLTLSSGPPVSITANLAEFGGVDPAEGTVKVLQVQETASAQTVTVNGVVKTVPALPAVVVTPPVPPVPPASSLLTFTYTVTTNASGVPVSSTCTAPVVSK